MLRCFVPVMCALVGANSWAQGNYKLSGPLATPPAVAGDVEDARISPDGRRLVYLARQDDPDVAELYSVPLDGSSEAVKLSGALVAGGAIDDYKISPDGKRVVYQADQEQAYEHGLYSVPIDGSASPTRLVEPFDNAFLRYEISPDGRLVVAFDTLDFRLRTVPIQGGTQRAPFPLRPGGYVFEARFSPDGERLLFTADPDGRSGLGLYSVRVDGRTRATGHARRRNSRPVRLSAPLAAGTDIFTFRLGPGGRAVYQVIGGTFDLFSVRIDGSARAVRLNPIPVPGGHVTYTGYSMSADGEWVVYRADQEQDEVYELYRVPADGSAAAEKLNGPLPPGGDVEHPGFEIAPDSRSVVYLADQDTDGVTELHAVPIDGSASSLRLSTTPSALGSLGAFRISPDAARVVYVTTGNCGISGLFSVRLDGGSGPVQLDGLPCDEEVEAENELEFRITPDGSRVVYVADCEADGVLARELYSVPIEGGASAVRHARSVHRVLPVRLNAALPPGGSVGNPGASGFTFAITPDGMDVVYRAGQETASVLELFRVPVDGLAVPRKLNPPLALGPPPGDVVEAKISARGRVVFRADGEIDQAFELFSVPLAGHGRPVKLDRPLLTGSSVLDFEIAAGIERVVFLARQGASVRLFSAPVDGGAQATELGGPFVAGGDVLSYHVSPDGQRVAYVADQDTNGVDELFCVPTDGSASAVKLNAPLPPGGSVDCSAEVHSHAHFSSDGERLVYLADQGADQVFELYSVSTRGGASPVRLNAPPVPGGDVAAFATCFLIGAGSRVVYVADQDANDVFELYSAPLDGSASPIKLSAPLAPGGDVSLGVDGVHLNPAGDRVVYRADQATDEAYELFSVPIDGSAAPVRLSGAMIPSGDVSPRAPTISPDGARVLYLADQERDGHFDLYSAPLDGGGPAVRLSSLPFHSRHVEELEVDPEGRFVVYRADQHTDQVFELYLVPVDGSAPAVRLLAPGSTVESFRIAADGEEVVFAAALEANGVNLWTVSIEGPGQPVRLSGPMAGEGVRTDPEGIWISPSGRIALYLADQDRAGVLELYGALLDRPRARRL